MTQWSSWLASIYCGHRFSSGFLLVFINFKQKKILRFHISLEVRAWWVRNFASLAICKWQVRISDSEANPAKSSGWFSAWKIRRPSLSVSNIFEWENFERLTLLAVLIRPQGCPSCTSSGLKSERPLFNSFKFSLKRPKFWRCWARCLGEPFDALWTLQMPKLPPGSPKLLDVTQSSSVRLFSRAFYTPESFRLNLVTRFSSCSPRFESPANQCKPV